MRKQINYVWIVWIAVLSIQSTFAQTYYPISKSNATVNMQQHTVATTPSQSIVVPSSILPASANLQANFSCKSDVSAEIIWSEDFDQEINEWKFETTNSTTTYWEVKNNLTGIYSFKNVDEKDVASLMLECHSYRYPPETATAISPMIEIPANGKLSFYIGGSTSFSSSCNLKLALKTEKEEDWITLWDINSTNFSNFSWRLVEIELTEYEEKKLQFGWIYEGYTGNFYLDAIMVSGVKEIEHISVMTGEEIELVDISTGEPTSWEWSFPGGEPEKSTEQNPIVYYTKDGTYDVTLTIHKNNESHSITKTTFVEVTGMTPIAKIGLPATFRDIQTCYPFLAPLQLIEFYDASLNYPTEREWSFSGVEENRDVMLITDEERPKVGYSFLNDNWIELEVKNQHGTSKTMEKVTVNYQSLIWNIQPEDKLSTFNLEGGYGTFPGSNKLNITEYAEKFSKPSVPSLIHGINVYFAENKTSELIEQLSSIKVALHECEDGLPGKQLDFDIWWAFELETGGKPTTFEFSKPIIIDDEFFVVVSGFPEYHEGCNVSFYMAQFRDQGNTSYMKQKGEWKLVSNYFPAGANHTSYAVAPLLTHSVMANLSQQPIKVDQNAGVAEAEVFAILGYKVESVSDSWCKVINKPNGLTLDTLQISYEGLPANLEKRSAIINLTDSLQTLQIEITQEKMVDQIQPEELTACSISPTDFTDHMIVNLPEQEGQIVVYDLSGKVMYQSVFQAGEENLVIPTSSWSKGAYLITITCSSDKYVLKGIRK